VVLATKALAADVAGERALVGVRAFMYHQVVRLGELPMTRAADELLTMPAYVYTCKRKQYEPK